MANLISNKDGQLMLLTAFLIIIGVVIYTSIFNAMVFSSNTPSTGLQVSKQDIKELREITESEIRAAVFTNITNISGVDITNETQVKAYFMNYTSSYVKSLNKMYSARGASVEVIINNVTFNKTTSGLTVKKYYIEFITNTFLNGSLIIPMDDNQTQVIKAYGLVFKTLDNTGSSGLTSTRIPVWTLLQNAVNGSVVNFSTKIYTDDNASSTATGIVSFRNYSGGPFVIDKRDINETQRQMILSEAKIKGIKVHELYSDFYYETGIKMIMPPKVAAYPIGDLGPMDDYYAHGDVPYTALSNTDITKGNLSQFDILTIPHHDMTKEPANIINIIVGWIADGGVTHVQCEGTDTMDTAVENAAGSAKPWYGFIGISKSKGVPNDARYIKLLDNSTRFNISYTFNMSPPMPLAGLASPGAPFTPLAQASNVNGIFGDTGGSTTAFSLRENMGQVNPDTNILGYASYADGTSLYGDYDSDGVKEPQLMYVEAPYDNGLVVYIAGHDLAQRTGNAERLVFESFFTSSFRHQDVTVVQAQNINVTIKYFDGKVMFEDTFIITI